MAHSERSLQQAEFAAALAEKETALELAHSERSQLKNELQDMEGSFVDLRKSAADAGVARQDVERRLNERFSEVATLTSLLRRQNELCSAKTRQTEWLAKVLVTMISPVKSAGVLLESRAYKIRLARLQHQGLFDAKAYTSCNPDVAAAGLNPLHHYAMHGMAESRAGVTFE